MGKQWSEHFAYRWLAILSEMSLFVSLSLPGSMAAPADPVPVPTTEGRSATGTGGSYAPTFSGDGRYVLFLSQAKDLTTQAVPSAWLDLYVRDLIDGKTTLVSANTNRTAGGNGDSRFATISRDGHTIAFESRATNLTVEDTNRAIDLFVFDLASGTSRPITRSTNGISQANSSSIVPLISPDGRRVVFGSSASNLVPNDTNGSLDLFLWDATTGSNILVSVNHEGTGSALGQYASGNRSDASSISADGRLVCYYTTATNAVAAPPARFGTIVVRDLEKGSNIWVNVDMLTFFPGATNPVAPIDDPLLSADGRFVFYSAREVPPFFAVVPTLAFRYDILAGTTRLIHAATNVYPLFQDLSEDGRFILMDSAQGPLIVDAESGEKEFVGDSAKVAGLSGCRQASLSGDGSRLAFLGSPSTNGPWSVYVSMRGQASPILASLTTNGTAAEVTFVAPVLSRDGTKVAFESDASDLVPRDFNHATDIFVRDLAAQTTLLVSQRAELAATTSFGAPMMTQGQSISQDGRYLVFASLTADAARPHDWINIRLRDTVAQTNVTYPLLSTNHPSGVRCGMWPVLSADGRYLAWLESFVTNSSSSWGARSISWLDRQTLVNKSVPLDMPQAAVAPPAMSQDGRFIATADGLPSSFLQVYVRDMWDNEPLRPPELISVTRTGQPAAAHCSNPVLSPNGRWVMFDSRAVDLSTNMLQAVRSFLYARDRATGKTRYVSIAIALFPETSQSSNAVFSADSRYVVFPSSRGTATAVIYRHDLEGPTNNVLVCADCSNPSVSADGRFVAYVQASGSMPRNIMLWDARTSNSVLVTHNFSGQSLTGGNRHSFSPQIAPDSRYVIFASEASDLVPNDNNQATDVFAYDVALRRNILLSRSLGTSASGLAASTRPVLAPDGRTILFASFANDLVNGDFNNSRELYLVQLGRGDTDGDEMDDDWELAYFNTLSRDGRGDFDADGLADVGEFKAGTDPTNQGSILQVVTIRAVDAGRKTVAWSSIPGKTYRLEFKRGLTDPSWTPLPGSVVAQNETTSAEDASAAESERFYRVVLVPE